VRWRRRYGRRRKKGDKRRRRRRDPCTTYLTIEGRGGHP